MAVTSTALAIAGTAVAAAGAGVQAFGAFRAAAASKRAERLRKKQLNLDVIRSRRERVREAMIASASATSNATAQGALSGSGIQGGLAQITGRQNQNISALEQNKSIGLGIFSANSDIASARSLEGLGGGLRNLGGSLFNISSSPLFRTA